MKSLNVVKDRESFIGFAFDHVVPETIFNPRKAISFYRVGELDSRGVLLLEKNDGSELKVCMTEPFFKFQIRTFTEPGIQYL